MTTRLIGVLCWTARIKIWGFSHFKFQNFPGEDPRTPFILPYQCKNFNTFRRPCTKEVGIIYSVVRLFELPHFPFFLFEFASWSSRLFLQAMAHIHSEASGSGLDTHRRNRPVSYWVCCCRSSVRRSRPAPRGPVTWTSLCTPPRRPGSVQSSERACKITWYCGVQILTKCACVQTLWTVIMTHATNIQRDEWLWSRQIHSMMSSKTPLLAAAYNRTHAPNLLVFCRSRCLWKVVYLLEGWLSNSRESDNFFLFSNHGVSLSSWWIFFWHINLSCDCRRRC